MEGQEDKNREEVFNFEGLPEVVKIEVFNKLTSLQDLKNCLTTSKSWISLLDGRKKEFLLPDVLPYVHKYLSKQDLDNCRQMCPVWKDGVDSFLQASKSRICFGAITSLQGLQKFNEDMDSYKGNPFPSRKLMFGKCIRGEFLNKVVVENEETASENLYGGFRSFASEFGEQVWELVYFLNGQSAMSANQVVNIPSYFRNLNDLAFCDGMDDYEDNEYIHTIKDIIQNIPEDGLAFSKLTGFKCLLFEGAPILNAVVEKYGSQLERLHCFQDSMTLEIFIDIARYLPNLKILKIFHCAFSIFVNRYSVLSQLPLRVLKLHFADIKLDVNETEKLINGLPASIVNLSLKGSFNFDRRDSHDFEGLLKRPELKLLSITYDFLQKASTLCKVLTNLGSIEQLRLRCPGLWMHFERNLITDDADLEVENLFLKCLTLQSVELYPSRFEYIYSPKEKIYIYKRKKTAQT